MGCGTLPALQAAFHNAQHLWMQRSIGGQNAGFLQWHTATIAPALVIAVNRTVDDPIFPSCQLSVVSGQWAVGSCQWADDSLRGGAANDRVICAIQPGGLAENSRWQAPAPPPEYAQVTHFTPTG